jgi:6-pyruvoyltetrahydropterin/6-carboxytetrahydropterin synthase
MKLSVTKRFTFEAAHHLPNYEGKCKNLHGHSYILEVTVSGSIDSNSGMVVDFSKLKKIIQEKIIDKYDHAYINDFLSLPTAENMIKDIISRIGYIGVNLKKIKLYETEDSWAEWEDNGNG